MGDRTLTVTTKVRDLASKELRDVGKTGNKAGGSIAAGFIKAQLAIGGMKLILRSAARLLKSFTTEVAEHGDWIAKTSRQYGLTTESLSKLEHVTALAGGQIESMTPSIRRLLVNMNDASRGIGEAKDAFEDLNFTVTDSDGKLKTVEDTILELSDSLGQMEDVQKRAALANDIFGRSGATLINILEQGSVAIREQMDEAERFGIVWTKGWSKAAEAFVDAQHRLDMAIRGIKMAIGVELLPTLTEFIERVALWISQNRTKIKTFVLGVIKTIADFAVKAIEVVLRFIGSMKDAMVEMRAEMFKTFGFKPTDELKKKVKDLWQGNAEEVETSGDRMVAAFQKIRKEFMENVAGLADKLPDSLPPTVVRPPTDDDVSMWDQYTKCIKDASTVTVSFFENLGAAQVQSTVGNFTAALDAVIDRTKTWKEAFRDMVRSIIRDMIRLAAQRALLAGFNQVSGGAGFAGLFSSSGGETTPVAGGGGKAIVVNQNVYPSPGMDEQAVADLAAASIQRELRTSSAMRGAIRKTAREGLY